MELNEKIENKELKMEFKVYSVDNIPDQKAAESISSVFINNYPEMYPEALRESDFKRYDSYEKIQQQVKDGNFFITANIGDKVGGITKFRLEKEKNFPDREEWLESWIMVDKPYREKGIGNKLLNESSEVLKKIKNPDKKVFFIADVSKDNIASIKLFKKNGWKEEPGKSSEYFLFRKEIQG